MGGDWKLLSEAVSREQDPQKLLELVEELNKALEEREKEFKRKQSNESQSHASAFEGQLTRSLSA